MPLNEGVEGREQRGGRRFHGQPQGMCVCDMISLHAPLSAQRVGKQQRARIQLHPTLPALQAHCAHRVARRGMGAHLAPLASPGRQQSAQTLQ